MSNEKATDSLMNSVVPYFSMVGATGFKPATS